MSEGLRARFERAVLWELLAAETLEESSWQRS
jgi:hypothetical protein